MRILFVAPYVPSLIRVRPYNIIRFLAEMGHEITVAALGADGAPADAEARAALEPFCAAVHVVPLSRRQAAWQCALRAATRMPLWAAYCVSPRLAALLGELVETQAFDVAHVEHLRAGHFAPALGGRLPRIFDSVDCITELQGQMMKAAGRGLLARAVSWEEYAKLRRYEPRMAAQFDRVLITSAQDGDCLRALGDACGLTLPVHVVPNGVDLDYFRPQPDVAPLPGNIVLSGKMSYAANRDAALYFGAEVFPALRRAHPGVTLTIAGSGPTPDLKALAARPGSGIEVTGRVPDLRPYLARASVAVCPLRLGVGIQNKVLEAMAMGKPVVATPLACRPLEPAEAGHGFIVADGPAAFAAQIVRLLKDSDEAARVGRSARRYVEERHDWRQIARRVTAIYHDAVAAHRPPATTAATGS